VKLKLKTLWLINSWLEKMNDEHVPCGRIRIVRCMVFTHGL